MNDTQITLVGNVVDDPQLGVTAGGVEYARFRVASTPRRYDAQAGWVDGETSFYQVVCWRTLATHVAGSVGRGDPVVVTGRLSVRRWQQEDRQGTSVDVNASSLGHDLRWGTSMFKRARRRGAATGGPEQSGEGEAAAATGSGEEWTTPLATEGGGERVERAA